MAAYGGFSCRNYNPLMFPLNYSHQTAGHSVRILAGVVDLLLVGLPALLFVHRYLPDRDVISGPCVLAAVLSQTTYGAVFEASRWRATIGKRLLKLQVVGERLGDSWAPARRSRCIARNIWKLVYIPSPIALALIDRILDDQNRGYHDHKAGTTVIQSWADADEP